MWLTHAGHRVDADEAPERQFPAHRVPVVRRRIAALLQAFTPSAVVSAPAAGADLIVLTEAIRLGLPVHVVLPLPEELFVRRSVADRSGTWAKQFRDVVQHANLDPASTVTTIDLSDDPAWFIAGNRAVLDRAMVLANEPVVALVVVGSSGHAQSSASAEFAASAAEREMVVLLLDPLDDAVYEVRPPDVESSSPTGDGSIVTQPATGRPDR